MTETTQVSERLLTRTELAQALRVAVRTVDEMLAADEVPVVRIRNAVRFYLPDVVRSLTANAVMSKRGCAHRLAEQETPNTNAQTSGPSRAGHPLQAPRAERTQRTERTQAT